MDHLHAYESQAAERYLLGELPPVEAEEFELHYFECSLCAAAVESGSEFIASARRSLAEQPERARHHAEQPRKSFLDVIAAAWRQPSLAFAMAAALILGAVALYQGTVLLPSAHRGMDALRVLPAFQLAGASRGEAARISVPANTPSFAVSVDVPPSPRYEKYLVVLAADAGEPFRVVSDFPSDGQPITILVPVKRLRPGHLELSIFGLAPDGARAEKVSDGSFDLQFTH